MQDWQAADLQRDPPSRLKSWGCDRLHSANMRPKECLVLGRPGRVLLERTPARTLLDLGLCLVRNASAKPKAHRNSALQPAANSARQRQPIRAHSPLPNRIRNVIRNLEQLCGKSSDLVGASN